MKSQDSRITVMTTTNELYLPTRLVYEVFDVKPLRAWLQKTSCVAWNPIKRCWTWNYDGAVRKMKFPPAYDQVPEERQPVVLASCYLVNDHTFHVYTRCAFRAIKFLGFFDRQVSRSVAVGKFIDEFNLITSVRPGDPVPFPEDYFKDESKTEFHDLIALMDQPNSPARKQAMAAYLASTAERTLCPLERHRLEGFYHDGPEVMEQMVRLREFLALLQQKSNEPIRPLEVMARLFSGQGGPVAGWPFTGGGQNAP